MYKKILLLLVTIIGMASCGMDANAASNEVEKQPSVKETKHLEHSLDMFSRKIVSKNRVMNMQYKRYGKQAVLSFDIIKPNEIMFMLYLLEYNNGGWRISKEYHYTKGVAPITASVC